jgi:fatty-acyl-CoA synthase
VDSTMQDVPLTVASLLRHGARIHAASEVVTATERGARRARFSQVADRVARLAAALVRLGVRAGDRVATYCWNTQEHLEAYLAIPSIGAVLHTVNIRLAPSDVEEIMRHAEDRVLIVDAPLVDRVLPLLARLPALERVIVVGDSPAGVPGALLYDRLLDDAPPFTAWPELDERSAAGLCYTSGTTGTPKGVAYSHRSTYLHSMACTSSAVFALAERDRVLPIVPMFHASAWGFPYASWLVGADIVLPGCAPQASSLARLIAEEKPTVAAAVPSVWIDLKRLGESTALDLSSLRLVMCGGAAVPLSLMQWYEEQHGVCILQGWGLTETSPIAALARPPKQVTAADTWRWRGRTGRIVPGIELRITDESGAELPWDDTAVGEIEVRGPWVTAAYYRAEGPDKFRDDGWFRTGDIGRVDPHGYIQITDRLKDVIKSGGEWISSLDLENALLAHPGVCEAAVIGVADERWQERPLACIVTRDGADVSASELRAHLAGRVARWWLPERWVFVAAIPRTSVGKIDKKELRRLHHEGQLGTVITARE